ncbi:unnamed protein product [Rotaria sordida]|uniref:RRM domain-containing protein n=1 Tax=Rotaria sordida TaxID=392033 RepID=A0A814C0A0_9BILA|nr:unnamed protein product [Rotaria sordida]
MSEHETGSSDDEERINEITTVKKKKGNVVYQRASRPTTYDDDDDDDEDEDEFNRQIRLEETKKLQKEAEQTKTRVDPDGTVYEWDPNVKGWFPKVSEEFLVEHHMNYGLETSSGIRYDVHHHTYIQERDGMTYKLDKDTQQWIPLQSYTDETNHIKYTFSKKHNTWIPDVSTYSINDQEGKQQTYVWLNDQLKWELLSIVDAYTDHITRIKYKWNNQTNSWDNEGMEPIEDEHDLSKEKKPTVPPQIQDTKKKPTEGWFELPDEKNCNVYISGLPLDITDEEFEALMSKYGIISPDPNDPRNKKIRLYRDEQGNPKGDGRCRYLRPESVKLCMDMLDDTDLRSSKIHVERAKFEVKGTFNPDLKRKRKKIDKKKKQFEVDKLLNWDERPEVIRHKYERIVAMKNMFDLQQFKHDPLFIDRLRSNVRESCSEYGEVKKINIYDGNPAGVVTVGFADIDQADACCQYMNGRIWYGRVIQCQTWDGDGRCRYLRPESVKLCIDMLDDTDLRSSRIHVERAKFEVKGTFNPDLKRKRKKIDKKKKQLEVDKLLNWDERPEVVRHKYERIVVMKNMFDLQQFKHDPLFIDRLRNNIRESCSEYGEVKKINIYDGNPAGVMTVGFADIDQADACCQYMNDRIWHGRIIQCQTWDGSTKYDIAASEEGEKERIDEWHQYLNEDDDDEKQT